MDDSNSNASTSSSTIDDVSLKSTEEPVNSSAMGIVQQQHGSKSKKTTYSTSFSDSNVDNFASSTSFRDISSVASAQEGATLVSGSQSMDSSLDGDQPSDTGVFHTKRKLHGKDKKICRVCGDKALGYNFNAMTCESCKAFFRRNALKQSTPNCMFQGNCVVDIRTRRFCPHCRLKKCFTMGMKKEMILEKTRLGIRSVTTPLASHRRTGAFRRLCRKSTCVDFKLRKESDVNIEPKPVARTSTSATSSGCSDSLQKPHTQPDQFPKQNPSHINRTLTDEEKNLSNLLENNFKMALETPVTQDHPLGVSEMTEFYKTLAVVWVKLILKFIKSVEDFKELDIDTQILCVKGCIPCCMLVMVSYSFSTRDNSLVLHNVRVGLEEFRRLFIGYEESTENLVNFILDMQDVRFKDPCLIAIFLVILVFSPFWDNLSHRRFLSNIQSKYLVLLKHYLEAKYSYRNGKELFALILRKLIALKELKKKRQEIIAQLGSKLDQFSKEIFGC